MKNKNTFIKSPLNYIGNKYKLLPQIIPIFPDKINTFVDLFGGSGVVSLNVNAEHILYNDIVPHIQEILKGMSLQEYNDIVNEVNHLIEVYGLSKTNQEGFEKLRNDYNEGKNEWCVLYTLMCYSFNNQYRFNNKKEYNSSFGKHKSCFSEVTKSKLSKAKEKLDNLDIWFSSQNFVDFDFSDFDEKDLVYVDPPYLGSLGNYNDGKRGFEGWNSDYENKLRKLLNKLDEQGVRFALSNNFSKNTTLEQWVKESGFRIYKLKCDYGNSSYHKKDRESKDAEVLITNY